MEQNSEENRKQEKCCSYRSPIEPNFQLPFLSSPQKVSSVPLTGTPLFLFVNSPPLPAFLSSPISFYAFPFHCLLLSLHQLHCLYHHHGKVVTSLPHVPCMQLTLWKSSPTPFYRDAQLFPGGQQVVRKNFGPQEGLHFYLCTKLYIV